MTAFTSVQTGDWDDPTTWDVGTGYPDGTDDTASIGHDVTIPAALSVNPGAISITANGLTINGTLDLGGAVSLSANVNIDMGPGSTLDLNGFDITATGATQYNFIGTAGSRVTVQSTTTRGSFLGNVNGVIPTLNYVDFSGCDSLLLGRTGTTAGVVLDIQYCTFDDCGQIVFDGTGVGANVGFDIHHCDFKNPHTVALDYPMILQTDDDSTATRRFQYCTWDCANHATLYTRGKLYVIDNCVLKGVQGRGEGTSTTERSLTVTNSYWENENTTTADGQFLRISTYRDVVIQDNFFYETSGDHPMMPFGPVDFSGNVCECRDAVGYGTNWLLQTSAVITPAYSIKNNIFLGRGNPLAFTVSGDWPVDFSNNTVYIDNAGTLGSGQFFATALLLEQTGAFTGTELKEVYNNLFVDPDDTDTRDAAIDLQSATADQLDLVDYNGGWGYPGGAPSAGESAKCVNVTVTGGINANEVLADPNFVDKDRTISTWDASLGGAGTKANALTEMLKLNEAGFNSSYTPAELVAYIKAGFTPQNTADYSESGRTGDFIGAVQPSAPALGSIYYAAVGKATRPSRAPRGLRGRRGGLRDM